MTKTWLITDTHFGHDKMIEYCGRPEDFSHIILDSLCMNVYPGDILIHLGDICINNDDSWHTKLQNVTTGVKRILVRGNHDHKSDSWYMSHGWDFVCESVTVKFMGKNILFSHAPLAIGDHDLNIHGHFHNTLHHEDMFEILTNKHLCLSIEETNYKPVLLETFIKGCNDNR